MQRIIHAAGVMLLLILFSGCATQRINQYKSFIDAGTAYADAVTVLTAEAVNLTIDVHNRTLLDNRNAVESTRKTELQDDTNTLQRLLTVSSDLQRHTALLKRYFLVLAELASSGAPDRIGREAVEFAAALQALSPRLEDATIGEAPVQDVVGSTVPMVVSKFRQKALDRVLRQNAQALKDEMAAQQRLLTILVEGMEEDLNEMRATDQKQLVEDPYVRDDVPLDPLVWSVERKRIMLEETVLASAKEAMRAASALEAAFVSLVEKRVEPNNFGDVFSDINALLDLVELVHATRVNQE